MKFRRDGTLFSITRMPKLFAQPALPQQVKPIKQKGA
jgi:hypothetical protein